MKNKLIISLGVSVLGILLGYILANAYQIGLCGKTILCSMLMIKGIGVVYGMQALAAVFAALIFVPRAFEPWKKFAIWYVPLMFLYFAIYENTGFFSIPEEQVYRFFSIVYVILSFGIIAWVYRKK